MLSSILLFFRQNIGSYNEVEVVANMAVLFSTRCFEIYYRFQ